MVSNYEQHKKVNRGKQTSREVTVKAAEKIIILMAAVFSHFLRSVIFYSTQDVTDHLHTVAAIKNIVFNTVQKTFFIE